MQTNTFKTIGISNSHLAIIGELIPWETPNMMDECNKALIVSSAKENLFTYKQMPISEFEFFMSKKFCFAAQLKYPDETTIGSLKVSSFDF